MIHQYTLYLWGIIMLAGCFQSEVDVPELDFQRELSVGAVFNPDTNIQIIHLNYSNSLTEPFFDNRHNDIEAEIYLYQNGLEMDMIYERASIKKERNDYGTFYRLELNNEFDKSAPVTLKIKTKEGYEIQSTTKVIENIIPQEIQMNCGLNEISFIIEDTEYNENYYAFNLIGFDNNQEEERALYPIDVVDPSINTFFDHRRYLIEDSFFDGLDKKVSISYKCSSRYSDIKLIWYNISKDMYDFERTARLIEEANRNPYIQKTTQYSNIIGGTGIFTFENRHEYNISE